MRMDDREEARNRGLALGSFHTQFSTFTVCNRCSTVSAVSPPQNALAGIDLRRLIYRAAFNNVEEIEG